MNFYSDKIINDIIDKNPTEDILDLIEKFDQIKDNYLNPDIVLLDYLFDVSLIKWLNDFIK